MRTNCPICQTEPSDSFALDFLIPDGWPCPEHNDVKLCPKCGFIWYDNDKTQADYDEYYRKYYGYHVNNAYNRTRLWNMARFIHSFARLDISIVDFGGDDGYLADHLKELGYTDVKVVNVGEKLPKADLIIASHVIEHIFDINHVINKFHETQDDGGIVLIELPESQAYAVRDHPPLLDYNQKHINHFSIFNLDLLMANHGYGNVHRGMLEYKPLNSPCYRALYEKGNFEGVFYSARNHIEESCAYRLVQLREIAEPVIVFGIGDIAMYLLSESNIEVAYFVDQDPAYEGQTLLGKPIKNIIDTDHPVVIMAQGQKDGILKVLEKYDNEVVVI